MEIRWYLKKNKRTNGGRDYANSVPCTDMRRDDTKVIHIGNVAIGGGNPIAIQSMTNTRTEDVQATVKQILALEKVGCEIIRCAVPTMEAAEALREIKKQIHIPLVADIHFDYRPLRRLKTEQIRFGSIPGISEILAE